MSALKISLWRILAWALVAAVPDARAAEAERLNVCFSSIAATSITTWVPYEAGIYKKYGLDVRIVYVAGAQAITTLISGDTQIVQGSGAAAALSRLSGSDLTVIGTTINVIPMSLVTTPDITTARISKARPMALAVSVRSPIWDSSARWPNWVSIPRRTLR